MKQRQFENGGRSCSALGMMGFKRSQRLIGWIRSQVPPISQAKIPESQLLLSKI
jgi:hypothetical protein